MGHLPVLFGYYASNIGNSHVPISLCRYWNEYGKKATLTIPSADNTIVYPWMNTAYKGITKKIIHKCNANSLSRSLAERLFIKNEKYSSPVYLWAGLSLDVFEHFNKIGTKIIIESINCHQATSRRLILDASKKTGITEIKTSSDHEIAEENRKLDICDAVFCPSPMVRLSMLENNVAETKLLSTSYGWEPERFPMINQNRKFNKIPIFLFAGMLCQRKGIPLLLEAWKRANIDGELLLCGSINADIQSLFYEYQKRINIRHIPYTMNIGEIYSKVDAFLFPSLEEGGPMVTYEAMAHGIPPIVTSMGGGAIVQHGINGLVLPDLEIDAWASAITEIAENPSRRLELGAQAMIRAQQFTWKNVALQRAGLLENKYPDLWNQ